MQDGLLLVAGTLCQCVNDHGEDDCGWCWCAGAELATRKRLARAACRGHSVQLTAHPPATLAEINDNGNTAAVGAARDNYPGPSVRIRTCHQPSCPSGGAIYCYSDAIAHLYKLASSFNRDVQ